MRNKTIAPSVACGIDKTDPCAHVRKRNLRYVSACLFRRTSCERMAKAASVGANEHARFDDGEFVAAKDKDIGQCGRVSTSLDAQHNLQSTDG